MKKILTLILALGLLTACSSSKKLPFKDDAVLYTIGNKETKTSDIYDLLVKNDQAISIYTSIVNELNDANKNSEVDMDSVNKRVEEEVAALKETFGEQLEIVIMNAGHKSLKDFIDNQLRPSIIFQIDLGVYVKENLESITKEYQIKDVSIFATDDKTLADKILASLKSDVKPSEIDLEEKATLTEAITSKSYDTKSAVLNKYLASNSTPGISEIIFDEEANIYYIVNIHDTDLASELDAVMATLLQFEVYADAYTATQFKEANFKIYDPEIKAMFDVVKPGYLN